MGTSGSSKGSQSNTPLVPTWLDEPQVGLLLDLGKVEPFDDDNVVQKTPQIPGKEPKPDIELPDRPDIQPRPLIVPPPEPERFRRARINFSRFASSGGANKRALHRAVSDYVRSGTRGNGNAVKRMGASRVAAGKLLSVFRTFQSEGLENALRYLNLEKLVGGLPEEIFLGLTEIICGDGGPIDEAISRDAWLETVAQIDQLGIEDLGDLTIEQVQAFFLSFIANSIEALLYQEVGANGFRIASGINEIEDFDAEFKSYIERRVRDSFSSNVAKISEMSDQDIRAIVDKTYGEAWELLELLEEEDE